MISNILIVCQGNICRSPMAAAVMEHTLKHVRVRSAGLGAVVGRPAVHQVFELLARRGVDVSTHRAAQISSAACSEAELILVMSIEQKHEVERRYPFTRGKVFLLRDFDKSEVSDPIGQSTDFFAARLGEIDEGIAFWARRLGYSSMPARATDADQGLTRATGMNV